MYSIILAAALTTGGQTADFGTAAGSQIQMVTKRGTNQYHGTILEFFRNDRLDANTFFANLSAQKKPVLRHNQFGGNFGGPILRNRLFFFFNYEGDRIVRGRDITGNVVTPALLAQIQNPALVQWLAQYSPAPTSATSNPLVGFHRRTDPQRVSEDTTLSRVDAILGKHRLSGRLVWNDQLVSNPQLSPAVRQYLPVPVKNWAGSDYMTISPTMSNELRVPRSPAAIPSP